MAAHPIVVIGDGMVQIPARLRDDPRFQDGATLELVPVRPARAGEASNEKPKGDWRRLRGIFKDVAVDLNHELNQDRLAELAADERMLNGPQSGR